MEGAPISRDVPLFKVFSFQQKLLRHERKQESKAKHEARRWDTQSTKTVLEASPDAGTIRDLTSAVLNTFKGLREPPLKD